LKTTLAAKNTANVYATVGDNIYHLNQYSDGVVLWLTVKLETASKWIKAFNNLSIWFDADNIEYAISDNGLGHLFILRGDPDNLKDCVANVGNTLHTDWYQSATCADKRHLDDTITDMLNVMMRAAAAFKDDDWNVPIFKHGV